MPVKVKTAEQDLLDTIEEYKASGPIEHIGDKIREWQTGNKNYGRNSRFFNSLPSHSSTEGLARETLSQGNDPDDAFADWAADNDLAFGTREYDNAKSEFISDFQSLGGSY